MLACIFARKCHVAKSAPHPTFATLDLPYGGGDGVLVVLFLEQLPSLLRLASQGELECECADNHAMGVEKGDADHHIRATREVPQNMNQIRDLKKWKTRSLIWTIYQVDDL